jgi:hypothetical protein
MQNRARRPLSSNGGRADLFRLHFASRVDFGPHDVAVHVNAAGHDNQAGQVKRFDRGGGIRRCIDDATIANPDVGDGSVNAIGRIVNLAARKF